MRALVCFPYAGAGASFFRSWIEPLSGVFEVLPVQLPGREERFTEKFSTSVKDAIASSLADLTGRLRDKNEIVLFGHSLGAALAFEGALQLTKECAVPVQRLVVSGAHAPTRVRARRASGLTADEFLARVRELAGYSHPALENAEMRELMLPILRADVEMHEKYVPPFVRPLNVPITCIRGNSDDLVARSDLLHWQDLSTQPLDVREVNGGHMYLVEKQSALFELLADAARCWT